MTELSESDLAELQRLELELRLDPAKPDLKGPKLPPKRRRSKARRDRARARRRRRNR